MNDVLKISVATVVISTLAMLIFRFLSVKFGLVDQPEERKIHLEAIPLSGGLAIFFVVALLHFSLLEFHPFLSYLLIISGLVVLVGLVDDFIGVSAMIRFVVQIVACLILIYVSGVQLDSFGQLLWPGFELNLGVFASAMTVFGVVGIINALNMADGIDGLAASMFLVPIILLLFLMDYDQTLLMILLVVVVFVFFNKSQKYKLFLGDAGSMFLGFFLGWILVYLSHKDQAVIYPVTALWLIAIPVIDTIFVMMRRILKGVSPFKPDKTHLHHYLLSQGYSQTVTLVLMVSFALIFVMLAYLMLFFELAESVQFYLFVLISFVYYQWMKRAWSQVSYV